MDTFKSIQGFMYLQALEDRKQAPYSTLWNDWPKLCSDQARAGLCHETFQTIAMLQSAY